MNRDRRLGKVISLLAIVGLTVVACADNDRSVYVQGVLAPPTNAAGGVCTYTADPTQPQIFSGLVDVGLSRTYVATVLVGNQMVVQQNTDLVRSESSRFHINGAVVTVTNPDGSEISSFTTLSSGFADVGTGTTPGYGLTALTLIDQATADKIAAGMPRLGSKQVQVTFKVFGKTVGGEDIESGDFQYPVRVCNGCLVTFPAGSQDEAKSQAEGGKPNCSAAATAGGSTSQPPCIFGQDQAVDCRSCQPLPACDPSSL